MMDPSVLSISEMQPTGQKAVAVTIALLILAILSVVLRVAARNMKKRSFDAGDICLVIGLCFFAAYCGTFIRGLQVSGGTLNSAEFVPQKIMQFYKYLFAFGILFTIALTFVKLSILLLYTSIFATQNFRRVARATMALCVVWCFVVIIVAIFQCAPIEAFWDLSLVTSGRAKCIPSWHILIAYEITNILVDGIILSLPINMIRTLQLPAIRKIGCACIFLLGGFVMMISIIRLIYLHNIENSVRDSALANGLNWTTAEVAVAIICASMPAYGPYINKFAHTVSERSTWTSSAGLASRVLTRRTREKASVCEIPQTLDQRNNTYTQPHSKAVIVHISNDKLTDSDLESSLASSRGSRSP